MSGGADPGQVASQGFGYRRGFVLGLTLAEAALLLVFVILLLMVAGFERRDRVIASLGSLQSVLAESAPADVDPVRYADEQLAALAELREAAQSAGHDWDDDFIELVRAIVESASANDLVDASKALQDKQDQLDRMLEALGDVEGAEGMAQLLERLADSEARLSNQHGQLMALRDRLERSGQGGVLPSCWMTPEGRIDYLLDVVLASDGIRMRESFPESRRAERDRLPLPTISSGRTYSQGEFQALTKATYDWSVARECRFYVTIFDGTRDHEKERYKSLLTTVEGHFYKRLTNSAAPF